MPAILLILVSGVIVYSNTFHASFHFDDFYYIVNNHFIRNISDLPAIWHYDPTRFITFFSLALNYHLNRGDVVGFHFFNLAVHLICALLVWRLILLTMATPAMKGDKITRHAGLIALLAGLVFVSHPLQTEAVTYIWQRAACLSALFYLASLCLYVRSRLQEGGMFFYICSLLAAVAAMFTKENAITLPLMVLFYEFTFLRTGKGFNWRATIPFLAAILIIPLTGRLAGSIDLQGMHLAQEGPVAISPVHYLLTEFRVIVTYIRLLVLPINQNLDYDYPVFHSLFQLPVLLSFAFLAAIAAAACLLFRRYRLISFSIGWFFLTLSVESSFIPFNDVIFEHRLYLPMAGYSLLLASGAYYLIGHRNIRMMTILVAAVIVFNSILTYERNKVWENEFTLWNDVIRKSPHKARPYNNRGITYFEEGRLGQAMADFDRDIAINPEDFSAYTYRGCIYGRENDLPQAIAEFDKAIAVNPAYPAAYYNRAGVYYELSEYDKARADLRRAQALGYSAIDPAFVSELQKVPGAGGMARP